VYCTCTLQYVYNTYFTPEQIGKIQYIVIPSELFLILESYPILLKYVLLKCLGKLKNLKMICSCVVYKEKEERIVQILKLKDIFRKNNCFFLGKIIENFQFFEFMHLKFEKVLI